MFTERHCKQKKNMLTAVPWKEKEREGLGEREREEEDDSEDESERKRAGARESGRARK